MIVFLPLIVLITLLIVSAVFLFKFIMEFRYNYYLNKYNNKKVAINYKRLVFTSLLILITVSYRFTASNVVRNFVSTPNYSCIHPDDLKDMNEDITFTVNKLVDVDRFDFLDVYFDKFDGHPYEDMYVYEATLDTGESVYIVNYEPVNDKADSCEHVDLFEIGKTYKAWGVFTSEEKYKKYGEVFVVLVD